MLYIHIGFHKTGTTTIQNFLKLNRELLASENVVYPKLGQSGAHFALAKQFRERKAKPRPKDNLWGNLRAAMQAQPDQNFVVSAETFHILPAENVQQVRQSVDGFPVTIIAYIRELNQFIPSRYAQRVKMGGVTADFDKFFASATTTDASEGLRYFKHIARWAEAFGWDAIRVRSLDRQTLQGGDLLQDFVAAIGLDFSSIESRLAPDSVVARNTAPGWKTLELLRELHDASGAMAAKKRNKEKVGDAAHLRRIAFSLRKIGISVAEQTGLDNDRGLYLTREQWERCNALYDTELRKLNEHIFGVKLPIPDRPPFEGRLFLPDATQVDAEERASFYREVLLKYAAASVDLTQRTAKKAKRQGKKVARSVRRNREDVATRPTRADRVARAERRKQRRATAEAS